MRRIGLIIVAFAVGGLWSVHAQTPIWVTPDVPTLETLNGTNLTQDTIYLYNGASYIPVHTVPGFPDVNAIHKMDVPGDWLFSVEAPSDLGGALLPAGSVAESRDVIWFDASAGTYTLCMSGAAVGLPPGSNVDSVYLDGGDTGDMIISVDVPSDVPPFVGPTAFVPGDLIRLGPTGAVVCPGWTVLAANPEIAPPPVPPIPLSSNTDGAENLPPMRYLHAFDVPTDLPPFAGPAAFTPGDIAEWNATVGAWSLFLSLGGWPISSVVDGISCGGSSPGRVPTTITLAKNAGNLDITWAASCAAGAADYGIYEGTIANIVNGIYDHTQIDCSDLGGDLTETITPIAASAYYLVVPQSTCKGTEGSYGRCSPGQCGLGDERPAGGVVCQATQVIPTPPACP